MRRWRLAALIVVLVCVIALSVRPIRHGLLRGAGSLLVEQDDTRSSDAVVLFTGVGVVGVLELIDLLNERHAPRAVILDVAPGREAEELKRRGLPVETSAARTTRLLHQVAVREVRVDVVTVSEGGTNAEAVAIKRWCLEREIGSITVITSRHHSARVRRVLERTFGKSTTHALVRIARFDSFDPSNWWQNRDSLRVGIIELQKLLLEHLRHPLV